MLAGMLLFLVEGVVLGLIWWWDARARKARLRRATAAPLRSTARPV
jgi:hypothetical protein